MKSILLISLLTAGMVFGSLSCRDENQPAAGRLDVGTAIDSLETKLGWVAYRTNLERWHRAGEQDDDSLDFFMQLRRDVVAKSHVYEALRGCRPQLAKDVDLRRFDIVYPVVVHSQIDDSRLIRGLRDSLIAFYDQPWCQWEGSSVSPEFLQTVVLSTGGKSSREAAYRTMSNPGEAVAQQLARLFRLRNQATRRMGYNDYFSLTIDLAGSETASYLQFLDAVDSVTRGPYNDLADELQASIGTEPLEVYDWESRFGRTMTEADALFPVDSQKVYLKRFAAGLGFDIDRLPIYWRTAKDNVAGDRSVALVVAPGHDVRIVARLTDGIQSYASLVRAFALALRGVLVVQESDLLARTVDPAWSEGIATLFERLAVETEWLQSITSVFRDLHVRLVRAEQAIKLLRLRLLLVEARLEYDAYRNPGKNLNDRYWDLFEEYVGLPRHDDLTPWAGNKAFVQQPLAAYYQLLGECVAAQNLNYLSSHYDRIVNNKELGSFLTHSYFRFGARYDWRELIERATDQKLSPDYLTRK